MTAPFPAWAVKTAPRHAGIGSIAWRTNRAAARSDGSPRATVAGRFRQRLAAGEFAVTAEIGPPRGADTAPVARKAAHLRGFVDAVNITDNQSAAVRLSSLAGSLAALGAGVEPDHAAHLPRPEPDRAPVGAAFGLRARHPERPAHDRRPSAARRPRRMPSRSSTWTASSCCGSRRHARSRQADVRRRAEAAAEPGSSARWKTRPVLPPGRMPQAWAQVPLPCRPPTSMPLRPGRRCPRGCGGGHGAGHVPAGEQDRGGRAFVQTQFVFDVPAFAAWMARIRDLGPGRALLHPCRRRPGAVTAGARAHGHDPRRGDTGRRG